MDIIDAQTLGSLIKYYRKAANLTQYELADMIEIDDKQLGKIERGVHYPSLTTFLKLIKVLNIDIKTLYSDSSSNENVSKLINLIGHLPTKELDIAYKIIDVIAQS